MSKAFTKENDSDEEEDLLDDAADGQPAPAKNYMTPTSFRILQEELKHLQRDERPKVVEVVAWAASNGDRSENGDYLYGKKRLREIDRRIRYLSKQLQSAEVVNPRQQQGLDRVFFGATVTYARMADDTEHTVTLVGKDEANIDEGKVSWFSPIGKALMKARVGDTVELRTPAGSEMLEVVAIEYRIVEEN